MSTMLSRVVDASDSRPITAEEIAWAIDHEAGHEPADARAPAERPDRGSARGAALWFGVPAAIAIIAVAATVALVA